MKNSEAAKNTVVAIQYRFLLWLLVGALALGQLQRIQITQSIAGYAHEVILFMIVCLGVFEKNIRKQCTEHFSSFVRSSPVVFVWLGWLVAVTVFSAIANTDLVPVLYLSRLALLGSSAFVLHQFFAPKSQYLQKAVVSLGVLWSILGLLQFIFLPDTRFLFVLGWDEHYYRLIGTLFDPAFMGMGMVLASILVMANVPKNDTVAKTAVLSVFATVCALTYSRASYGALLIAYAGIWLLQKKPALVPLTVSLVIASFVLWLAPKPGGEGVLLTRTASVSARTTQIEQLSSSTSVMTLIFGEGLFAEQTVSPAESYSAALTIPNHARVPDNIVLLLFRGTGLIGLALTSVVAWTHIPHLLRTRPYTMLALVSLFWHSQFNNTLLQPFMLLFLLLGFLSETPLQAKRN